MAENKKKTNTKKDAHAPTLYDPLTGLFNRDGFLKAIEDKTKNKEIGECVMVCLNVRNFKMVNSLFGTIKGDEILQSIGVLLREREQYGLLESISLATEMMRKRLLHPAIISACRTVDELDVYLDCLDKNELNDFKIFKIEYELYPMVVKNKNNYKFENKKETNHKSKRRNIKKGTRYKEDTETIIWKKIKNNLNMKRAEGYK